MSGSELCMICMRTGEPAHVLQRCERTDCPIPARAATWDHLFVHATPKPDACDHHFQGWREIDGGLGGEQICTKCGIGAMEYTLRTGI